MSLKKLALTSSILAGLTVGATAQAQDSGYYVQGHGGASFVVQDDVTVDFDGLGEFDGSYDADTGYAIGGAFGKYFGNGLRSDIELTYRSNDVSEAEFEDETLDVDGEVSSTAVFLNGYYDFAIENSAFVPYIGAGLGYVNVDFEDESEGVFGYQFKAGVGRTLGNGATIGAEATYLGTSDVEIDIDGDSAEIEYGTTSLLAFYRFSL